MEELDNSRFVGNPEIGNLGRLGQNLDYAQCMVGRRTARGLKFDEGTVRVNVFGLLVENHLSPGTR